jgi:MFS family permease
LLALGVFGVLFPAVQFDADHDLRLALLLVPALALLAGFVGWERGPGRRRGYPLVDLRLFRIRSFADGTVLAVLFFCAYTGTPLVLALFLQDGLGFSPLQSGLTASAYAVGSAVSAPIGGRLLSRLGQRLLVGALALFGLGVGAVAVVAGQLAGSAAPATVALAMAPALLVAGLGGGSVVTPNQALSLADVDSRGGSTAGGVLQTAQRVGNAVGAAVITAVFYASVSDAAPGGSGRQSDYGRAYALSLVVSVVFSAAALVLAIRDVRRRPAAEPVPR